MRNEVFLLHVLFPYSENKQTKKPLNYLKALSFSLDTEEMQMSRKLRKETKDTYPDLSGNS